MKALPPLSKRTYRIGCWDHEHGYFSVRLATRLLGFCARRMTFGQLRVALRELYGAWAPESLLLECNNRPVWKASKR